LTEIKEQIIDKYSCKIIYISPLQEKSGIHANSREECINNSGQALMALNGSGIRDTARVLKISLHHDDQQA